MSEMFSAGKQPCDSFLYPRTIPAMPDARCPKSGCVARVRFCSCCSQLHHQGGLETCPVKPFPPEPRMEPKWDF